MERDMVITDMEMPEDLLEEIAEFVSEYITDKSGYCFKSAGWNLEIKVNDIEYDIDGEDVI